MRQANQLTPLRLSYAVLPSVFTAVTIGYLAAQERIYACFLLFPSESLALWQTTGRHLFLSAVNCVQISGTSGSSISATRRLCSARPCQGSRSHSRCSTAAVWRQTWDTCSPRRSSRMYLSCLPEACLPTGSAGVGSC